MLNCSEIYPKKVIYAQKRGVKDGLDCDDRAFGFFKDEAPPNTELLTFTTLRAKNYNCDFGKIIISEDNVVSFVITDTLARCKGLSLQRQNVNGLISKNLMRKFLEALAREETMEIAVPQQRFQITPKTYEIKPREIEKLYTNKRLLLKRLYDPKRSLTKTWPIGATSYYPD